MNSTKRTKITLIIILTTFLSVVFLLALHTTDTTNTTNTTKLNFTNSLIPSTVLCDNSITPHLPKIIEELNSTSQTTDYHTEDDCEFTDPFIQNPNVIPEVLLLDEDINS